MVGPSLASVSKRGKINHEALDKLKSSLGIHEFKTNTFKTLNLYAKETPAQWIKEKLMGKAECKKGKIIRNIRFCLGNGRVVRSMEEIEGG